MLFCHYQRRGMDRTNQMLHLYQSLCQFLSIISAGKFQNLLCSFPPQPSCVTESLKCQSSLFTALNKRFHFIEYIQLIILIKWQMEHMCQNKTTWLGYRIYLVEIYKLELNVQLFNSSTLVSC